MSEGTISVPTWALPVVAGVLSIAVAWGAANARAEATEAEVDRIERVVTEAAEISVPRQKRADQTELPDELESPHKQAFRESRSDASLPPP